MKTTIKLVLLLIPFSIPASVLAQQYPGMESQPDMKNMMATMQKMQACMQKINKKKMNKLERKSQAFSVKIQLLCAKGKRTEAEKKSFAFDKKMISDPTAKKIQQCTDIMVGMAPISALQNVHACDEMQQDSMFSSPPDFAQVLDL